MRRRRSSKLRRLLTLLVFIAAIIWVIWYFIGKFFPAASTIAKSIIVKPQSPIESTNGHTNILILGIGGGTHDGPDLTDTIIFASIDQNNDKVTLISIPRDLWVTDVGNGGGKINEAYADGEENDQHKGLIFTKALAEKITGQPIHYGFRLDFSGFVKAVDLVGGLDVHVDNTLDDYVYPIEGKEDDTCGISPDTLKDLSSQIATGSASEIDSFPCRYKHLHVDKGLQHMDGELALEFVRSRHGVGKEGTDFARSHRQQEVIEAFREKLFSVGTIFNPSKMIGLINILKDSIDTDIPQEDYVPFVELAQKLKNTHINSNVIDFGDASQNRFGLLMQPPISAQYDFASILLPRAGEGNYTEIQKYVSCEITIGNCTVGENVGEIITPTPIPTASPTK